MMKRRWYVIQNILEHVEAGDLRQFCNSDKYWSYLENIKISDNDYVGHIEILVDAGIIKNCEVRRDMNGEIILLNVNGPFISMEGHDLLDALRDQNVWDRIRDKAKQLGVSLSWEFIKAAVPIVIREMLQK